jgi:DMSO/TMAO reductase YedYZ heme-binding membrane subunit
MVAPLFWCLVPFLYVFYSLIPMKIVYDYITKLCKQQAESYKIMITKMFAILDKAKPDIESIRGLNLAAVKHTTVHVTRLPL